MKISFNVYPLISLENPINGQSLGISVRRQQITTNPLTPTLHFPHILRQLINRIQRIQIFNCLFMGVSAWFRAADMAAEHGEQAFLQVVKRQVGIGVDATEWFKYNNGVI